VVIADPTVLRPTGRSGRAPSNPPRGRRLDAEGLRLIAFLAEQGRTLRDIAAEVGVSYETVRAVFRESDRIG
jgi:AcrR family transcriptional regulator